MNMAGVMYHYTEIPNESEPMVTNRPRSRRIAVDILPIYVAAIALFFIASCTLSFSLGKWNSGSVLCTNYQSTEKILGLQHANHKFTYNPLYTSPVNITTDKAWLDLFPYQGGFFQHPHLAPKRATFAVFHQLHCLDNIRKAFAALQHPGATSTPSHNDSSSHIQHCIELLRETLICQPDFTIEFVDDDLGGVTGFGTEHVCIDWQGVVAWTSQWENYGQEQ